MHQSRRGNMKTKLKFTYILYALSGAPTALAFLGLHVRVGITIRDAIGDSSSCCRVPFPVDLAARVRGEGLSIDTLCAAKRREGETEDTNYWIDDDGTAGVADSDKFKMDRGQEGLEEYGLHDTDFQGLEREFEEAKERVAMDDQRGMDVAMDDMTGHEDMDVGADLADMLMERSIRFYDPKVTGDREKCYLVGLEARGFGGRSAKGTGAVPEDRSREGESQDADDWDEEKEAAYQEEKLRLYEKRRDERENRFTLEESMAELSELAGTAGLEVVGSTYQRVLEPNPRTYIGTGKVREIKSAMDNLGVCTVIFDDELSPGQQRSLEVEFGGEKAGIKVLDRTALILDIFAQHARTKEGQIQVELALHMYRLPRLTKLWTHLERQGGGSAGGVGLRGPGERQLEVDRRLLKDKIIALKKELAGVRRHRDMQRRSRKKLGLPVVSLVGYTNAGKSTLLNGLTRAGVMAENLLFATLDPTTRKVRLPGLKVHPEVMLTDTVGFIQKLPTNLVAAFRATLEEVAEADVVVHVLDVSSPSWKKQESAVLTVLEEMGVADKPRVTMWNKIDLLQEDEQLRIYEEATEDHALTVAASAKTGMGMDAFVGVLEEAICELLMPVEAVVPYSRGDLMNRVHELGACNTEEYTDKGTFIQAQVPPELMNKLKPYYTEQFRRLTELPGKENGGGKEEEVDWNLVAKKRDRVKGGG